MRLTLERQFPGFWNRAQKFVVRQLVKTYEPYHPVFLGEERIAEGQRACIDRWSMIREKVEPLAPKSVLDLGCAEGYFVQQAAKSFDCIAVGVDADIRRLTIARAAISLSNLDGAAFFGGTIDEKLLKKLPPFEIVIFLSVLHHVMYEHGIDYSRTLLSAIRARTLKCLVFDMGQSNETSHEWSSLLPPMQPDPESWIKDLLLSAGFSSVEAVGQTDAYKSSANRILFVARP